MMLSHNVMLSRNVMLSCQTLSRSAQVVSPRTSWVAAARRNLRTSITHFQTGVSWHFRSFLKSCSENRTLSASMTRLRGL